MTELTPTRSEIYTIEPYQHTDRLAVETICAQTGLRGRLSEFFCDRELFVKFWLSPYLDAQPENCLVGRNQEGEVCGYLVGSVGAGYAGRVLLTTAPHLGKMLIRNMMGKYRHHPPTGRFIYWLLVRSWRESPSPPADIPAHFHFNVRDDARKGLGWQLLDGFEEIVRARGGAGWYAILFSSVGHRDAKIYERLGFHIGERRRCTLFTEETNFLTIYRRFSDKPLDRTRLGRLMERDKEAA